MEQADCIIVGGGIGGAVLGLALAQKGIQVLILEKELTPPAAGRPEVLASSTVNIFHRLGVGERFIKESAVPLKGVQAWQSGTKNLILDIHEPDLLRNNFQPYSTNPNVTRKIILELAEKSSHITVKRGVEVTDLIREGGRIVGVRALAVGEKMEFRSRLVVGDDGGHSKVRSSLGIHLKLREFPLIFLAAAGNLLPGQPADRGQVWISPKKIKSGIFGGIFLPQLDGKSAFVFLMAPKIHQRFLNESPEQFYQALTELSPLCFGIEKHFRFPDNFHVFHRPYGHSKTYVADGAVLIGDAAHPVTPAGGQGANMSVADAVSLARIIEADLKKGRVSLGVLKQYEQERRPANQRSVQISARTDLIFRIVGTFQFLMPVLIYILRKMNRDNSLKDRFVKTLSQSFLSD